MIDSNDNGMSDLWEKAHNSGNLFLANFDPLADPDNDSWTNTQEAAAGMSPFEPNPPMGYVQLQITQVAAVYITSPDGGDPELLSPEAFVTSWPTLTGKQYTLLCSPDLAPGGWLSVGEPLTGDGLNAEIAISPSHSDGTLPDKLFWRVAVDDVDTDGDSFTNYEEFQLGTDPASIDTDLDGIVDNLDPLPLASATAADPDGVNPPPGSTANLRGFWDFESTQGTGSPAIFPDRSGANRHATSSGPGPQSLGMPSQAGRVGPGYITIPDTTVEGQAAYTVSGWFKLAKDSIKTSNGIYRIIYALYDQTGTGPAPQYVPLAQGTILALRITALGEQWYIGGYQQTFYYNQYPYINGSATTLLNGYAFTRPAGTSDDGKWHHFAATRSTASNGQKLYLDGQLVIEEALREYPVAYDSNTTFTFGSLYPGHSFTNLPDAHIDRLRVHSRLLTQTEVAGLHHQDIDRDGLWDITETSTRLWRDNNSDGQATANEQQFSVSPFGWQVATSDTDDDELPDLTEQTLGTAINNPDTDSDLLPDGWEYSYGMSPLTPGDATANPDNDGLNNLDEYRYNTKPNVANSDGDDKNDGSEVSQGSDPNDPGDGGNPIPAAEKISILLGIGDQSGSESEDYVLNCYHIDPQSGQENRVYTLRSGGFGQYKEETKSFFKKGETYTFQIDWQSSNMSVKAAAPGSPTEGPDYDYTFKVQPQGSNGGPLFDSWDKGTGAVNTAAPILATDASDVATTESEFKQNYESKRVALVNLKVEWESIYQDAALDDHVDPWTHQANGKRWFPDAPNPNAVGYRDIVGVKVKGGLPNTPVWLRSLDVDDTTSEVFDTDHSSQPPINDTNGANGFDNRTTGSGIIGVSKHGAFQGPESRVFGRYTGKLDQKGSVLAQLRIGTSPGNNYRVAATMKSKEELDTLHTAPSNPEPSKLVSPISSASPTIEGAISPTLTSWRRLWLEIDTMTSQATPPAGQENWIQGNVIAITTGTPLPAGAPVWDCVFNGTMNRNLDEFENGWLINGTTHVAYAIHDVVQHPSGEIVVRALADPGSIGPFTLLDDDNTALPAAYSPILPRYSIDYPYVAGKFKTAFISLLSADAYNLTKTIPFKLNEPGVGLSVIPVIWNDGADLTDSKSCWVAHAVFGFQDSAERDGDPNIENSNSDEGVTPFFGTLAKTQYSVIWLEQIRESFAPDLTSLNPAMSGPGAVRFIREINLTTIHEIGHQPSTLQEYLLDTHHGENGIMSDGGNYGEDSDFTSATIARFRRTLIWKQSQPN